jgi:16S rRNA (guanine527-N7)-methyltransferase
MSDRCDGRSPEPGDAAIATYRELLARYRTTLDLMSPRGFANLETLLEDAEAYARAVRELVGAGVVVDVGSGAGLPAAVIAARCPERPMMWVERRRKRATFLEMVVANCGFGAVQVVAADVRSLLPSAISGPAAGVTGQAVAGSSTLYHWTRALHATEIVIVVRRGGAWQGDVASLAEAVQAEVSVLRAETLTSGGTLVAVRVAGGLACP